MTQGIGLATPSHLGACRGLEELVGAGVEQLPVAAHVREILPQNSWVQATSMISR